MQDVESWENSGGKLPQGVSNSIYFSKHGYLRTGCLGLFSIWVLKISKKTAQLWEIWHTAWQSSSWKTFSPSGTPYFNTCLVLPSLERTDWLFLPDSFLPATGSLGLLRPNTMRYSGSFLFSRLKYFSPQPLLLHHELQNPALMALHSTHFK